MASSYRPSALACSLPRGHSLLDSCQLHSRQEPVLESSHTIRMAEVADRIQLAEMRTALWPDSPFEEHLGEIDGELATGMSGTLPIANFVAQDDTGHLIGFIQVGMRSHADGCNPRHPVGYIEGWYVRDAWRNCGVGKALVLAAENWASQQGCAEMASDSLFDNQVSLAAHEALGYQVVDRCFHYRKTL
jgi:aminoglycoside 6'-N-acetyltransferase I